MHSLSSTNLFAFTLGRESKLSLAELFSLFGEKAYENHSDEIAIFALPYSDTEISAIFRNIGGSVRVMRLIGETEEKRFPTDVIREIGKPEGKYVFALWVYGGEFRLSDIGLRIKKTLKDAGISVRLVNIENKNIVSAVYKKERLQKSKSEYNLIHLEGISYIAVTLACQDIDAYTKRDTGKVRDMEVGMMPPKLCQMMINIANEWGRNGIYDPFCGLGTVLIEAANMGTMDILGSDFSSRMVHSAEKSLWEFIREEKVWQDRIRAVWGVPSKDFTDFASKVFETDASKLGKATLDETLLTKFKNSQFHIVSEGYLGEIMQKDSITLDRVKQERAKLRNMYDGFFGGLCGIDFSGNIVMTFPFWDIHGTTSFFTEIYDVIGRHGFDIIPLLPSDMRTLMTPKWTLLYKRPGQNVGREVIKIHKRNTLWKR
jgi:tRNA G10  N-methylase Trm11